MKFDLKKAVEVLERTPAVLRTLLQDLSTEWVMNNEGGDSWSPYDVIGHLIHGEMTDWIPRTGIILLQDPDNCVFQPFDRFAQFDNSKGKNLSDLLSEFEQLRRKNLDLLRDYSITEADLQLTGIHPELGKVNLAQLLATWVTHDLTHIAQISRVMAKQYKDEVGPWRSYIGVLRI